MKISDVLSENEYYSEIKDVKDKEFFEIASKTDEITENSLFILIESINYDLEKIINYIEKNTPKFIVCEEHIPLPNISSYVLYVENARRAMSYIYARFYSIDFEKMKFIGITGTNGKTTTASILKELLKATGEKIGFIGTGKIEIDNKRITDTRYSMTTPDPKILYSAIAEMQKETCKYVIMEVSSHSIYFDKISPIPFEIAIFTNLSEEHLDFHKNIEEYFNTKLRLFKQAKIGIFNADDKYSRKAMEKNYCFGMSIGILWEADANAREISIQGFSGSEFIYRESSLKFKAKTKLPGGYNVYNALFALKAAITLGVAPCIAKKRLGDVSKIEGRYEIIDGDITVIIDYAHTSAALENLLKSINSVKKPRQKLTIVFGCGGERDRKKRPEMARIAERLADFSIITLDNSRNENEETILSDILSGFERTEKRKLITSRKQAIEFAVLSANDGDIVAVIGKGHEKYNIDKTGYHDFDEKEIIQMSLKRRKGIVTSNES
jgi:UDP-N-acetylmuramoyl-L-alanyl-D-glutamate--2,6-diaminopimelate ligase